jgi:hypothetical protein
MLAINTCAMFSKVDHGFVQLCIDLAEIVESNIPWARERFAKEEDRP